jgi:hypothetical protein
MLTGLYLQQSLISIKFFLVFILHIRDRHIQPSCSLPMRIMKITCVINGSPEYAKGRNNNSYHMSRYVINIELDLMIMNCYNIITICIRGIFFALLQSPKLVIIFLLSLCIRRIKYLIGINNKIFQ